MALVKVAVYGTVGKSVSLNPKATEGATIGANLFLPDGSIATQSSLATYLGVTAAVPGVAHHRLLQGLTLGDDHPQYTRKDTLTTRGDLYVRDATTITRLAKGSTSQFLQSGATDPAWQTISPVITLSTDLSGNTTLTNLTNGTLAATIVANVVTDGKLRQSAGLSVIGRSANTTGNVADVTAASDSQVLRRSGTSIGFGAIDLSAANAITGDLPFSNLTQGSALSVLGVAGNATADLASIASSGSLDILRRSGSAVGFGTIDHTYISDFSSAVPQAANPTASIGLTAANGSAITFMRSDGAPALSQSISPTWTGTHIWSSTEPRLLLNESDAGTNLKLWDLDVNGSVLKIRSRTDADGAGSDFISLVRTSTTAFNAVYIGANGLTLGTTDTTLLVANSGIANIDSHSVDTAANFRIRRYNGSQTSSPTEILSGNILGQFIFQGYGEALATVKSPVVIAAVATSDWSSSSTAAKLTFTTTATGGTSAALSLTLQGNQIQAEDGTVAAPAWTFRNDRGCGAYRIGSNNLGIAVNGAQVLDISTTGLGVTGTMVASGAISGSNLSASGGANPSASVGLAAVNGSAITYMRSDGAPALDQDIAPTWTNLHIFTRASSSQLNKYNSDTANGPFVSFSRSSTTKSDIGNAAAIIDDGVQDDLGLNTRASGQSICLATNGLTRVLVKTAVINFIVPPHLPNYTVSGLPSASTIGSGGLAFVTDATQTAILGLGLAVVGGGANKVPVYSDGTNWIII